MALYNEYYYHYSYDCYHHYIILENGRWDDKVIECASGGRAAHASCTMGKYVYIIGGYDGVKRLNDVQMFDIETQTWSSPHISGQPPNGYILYFDIQIEPLTSK